MFLSGGKETLSRKLRLWYWGSKWMSLPVRTGPEAIPTACSRCIKSYFSKLAVQAPIISSRASWLRVRAVMSPEVRAGGQVFPVHQPAQVQPFFLAAHRQGYPLVVAGCGVATLGRPLWVAVADTRPIPAVDLGVHDVLRKKHHACLVHADVDPLAQSRLVPVPQRGAHGEQGRPRR